MLHPFLTHYQTFEPATGPARSTGTSGEWNAANGSSSGWQQMAVRPRAVRGPAGRDLDHALSDWGFQQFPGVFIDDIAVSTGEGSTSFEDDGDPMDGWTVSGAPQDAGGDRGRRTATTGCRRGGLGIKEGAVVATADTLYMGFGFEGITDAATRRDVMGRAITYLLR